MHGKLFFIGTGAFALGVLLRTLYVIPWQVLALAAFLGVLCAAMRLFEKHILFVAASIALLMFAFGAIRTAVAPVTLPVTFAPLLNHKVTLTGIIVADPDIREKNQQLVLEVDQHNVKTDVLIFAPLYDHFIYGEAVTAKGELEAPAAFMTDTGRIFRYDQYLEKKSIFSTMNRASVSELRPPQGFLDWCVDGLYFIKHTFVAGLARALPDPFNELATGLLTGDQHTIDDSILTMLELSGLVWVIVLSGYHVTIIAEAITRAFGFLPRRFALMFAGVGVASIVFATGASAPSLRGSIMAGFALFADGTGRRYDSLRALAATLIIVLLWNPLLLAYDQGFQLSLIVTPAIILGMPLLEARLLWLRSKLLIEVISVSVIAQLACLPLIVWQEGQLEVWAIPANMFVTALVPLVMLLSVIAGFAGIVAAPLAPLIGYPAYCLLYFILAVAHTSSSLPYANLTLPPFSFIYVIIAYTLLIAIVWWMKKTAIVSDGGL